MQLARVFPTLDRLRRITLVDDVKIHAATTHAQRRFDGFHDARPLRSPETQAILDDFERIAVALVDARIALLLQQRANFGFLEILRYRHGKADVHTRIAGRRSAAGGLA